MSLAEQITCAMKNILTFTKIDKCFRKDVSITPPTLFERLASYIFGTETVTGEQVQVEVPQWVNLLAYIMFLAMILSIYTLISNIMPKHTVQLAGAGAAVNSRPPLERSPTDRQQQSNAYD